MITYYLKQYGRLILYAIIFWTIAFSIFVMIRYFGIDNDQAANYESDYIIPVDQWLKFVSILGVFVGVVYGTVEYIFDQLVSKKVFLLVIILIKSIIYFVFLVFTVNFIMFFIEDEMNIDLPNESGWWETSHTFWLIAGYFFLCSLLFYFFRIVDDKFGKGMLFAFLIGKYRRPKEERHIFMFIDLKSSTTIAEELGHYKYSQLIQDCFYDLNTIVGRYNAMIYQYVGDEAVLSWEYNSGIKQNRCIDLFFHFDRLLKKQKKYYLKHYKTEPNFKAAIHGGTLMASEVGSIKKELAFHGDVINTTARIQEQCTEYDKSLLISEKTLNDINLKPKYFTEKIGDLLLRGKQETIQIHAIERK